MTQEQQGTHRYDVTIRAEGHPDQTIEVHPHPLVDPERPGDDLDSAMGWWWDVAGMAIVKAGEPWTTLTGVTDFHEVPGDAEYDDAPRRADVVVTILPEVRDAVPAQPTTHITITKLVGRSPLGTDGT